MHNPESSVAGFADAMRKLAAGGESFRSLSAGALQRARELSWDDKAAYIAQTYDRILANIANRTASVV